MNIRPIKTAKDYEEALQCVDALLDATAGSSEGTVLDLLATLVETYERDNFPMQSPDPVEAILFRMEQMGIDRKMLEPRLGGRGRVSEVLNRKRGLSITQIRRLHEGLNIPYENLMGTALK